MRTTLLTFLGILAVSLAAPGSADAQSRPDRGEVLERPDEWDHDEEDDLRVILDRDGRVIVLDRDRGERARRGPAFCRSGEGHPVHGRAWCLEKGFGPGHEGVFRRDAGDRRHDRWDDRSDG